MADDPPSSGNANPDDQRYQSEAKVEDADTRAAREELRHSHISDSGNSEPQAPGSKQDEQGQDDDDEMRLRSGREFNIPHPTSARRNDTPDLAPPEALSRDDAGERKVSSPKKKRAHDEVEAHKDSEGHASNGTDSDGWVMVDEGDTNKGRSEPQKKRARDETSPPADIHQAPATNTSSAPKAELSAKDSQPPQTSPSKFADSGFAKLATSSASPFATVGANKSVFGGGATASPSPFASFGAPASTAAAPTSTPLNPPKLSFGSKDASAPSPFAAINGAKPALGGFGGGFGGGSPFSGALGGTGPMTGNFASPGQPPIIKSDKPAKPFGAPESDAEDDSEDDSDDGDDEEGGGSGGADAEKEKDKDETASTHESTPAAGDDEKKGKFKRVAVDDGEAGETTIVQVRARMYYLDKTPNADNTGQVGWRERGVGNLRINVPEESVTTDPETGAVDPKSFDPAVLKGSTAENPKLVRLVMRQDSTLRVILNTVMVAGMNFQLNEGFKTWSVLFTAIEGDDGQYVPITMKVGFLSHFSARTCTRHPY
ncbi:hypothetical protein F5883DRAFT_109689 [Diaporthe sp. PMI_573]|nr:hypothetical protein F5883DRAFT_109689 [Diaporthaceae sp. PMI_573]